MPRPPDTLLQDIQARTGSLRKTYRVGKVVTQWAVVHRDLGRTPLVREYASWWKVSERTAWREMAIFTEAYPGEPNPDRLAAWALEQSPGKLDVAAVLSMPFAGLA